MGVTRLLIANLGEIAIRIARAAAALGIHRRWVVRGLRSTPPPSPRSGKKRPCIDTW